MSNKWTKGGRYFGRADQVDAYDRGDAVVWEDDYGEPEFEVMNPAMRKRLDEVLGRAAGDTPAQNEGMIRDTMTAACLDMCPIIHKGDMGPIYCNKQTGHVGQHSGEDIEVFRHSERTWPQKPNDGRGYRFDQFRNVWV